MNYKAERTIVCLILKADATPTASPTPVTSTFKTLISFRRKTFLKDEDLGGGFLSVGNLQLLKMMPSGIERHKDWWNELYKKTSKEVSLGTLGLNVFL